MRYKAKVEYTFGGIVEIEAENEDQAKEYLSKHFGCVLSGNNPHTTMPDDDIDWEFDIHPRAEEITIIGDMS